MKFAANLLTGSIWPGSRRVFAFVLMTVVMSSISLRAEDDARNQAALNSLIHQAYANSPELRAAYARWQSALERVPQEEALPDPTIGYGYFVERMETRQLFRVEQMFPGPGKRGLRGAVAGEAAAAEGIALESRAADIRMRILQAAANYVLALRSAEIVADNLALVEQLEGVARQRYRTGDASQADVLRLESEVEALRTDLQSWHEREAPLRARINAIIGRASTTPVPGLTGLPPATDLPGTIPDNFRQHLSENPDLREGESRIRRAEQASELSRRASRPDIMVGMEFMDNLGMAPDEVMAMVSISIPLWQGRYRALRRETAADLIAARQEYHARRDRIEADAHLALYEAQDSIRRMRLFDESLLPRARQTLSIVEAEYRTGKAGFLDLLESQRTLLNLELGLLRAKTDVFIRTAEWERLAGSRWNDGREIWGSEHQN